MPPPHTSNTPQSEPTAPEPVGDEDEWESRIKRTGCYSENERLLICHYDTGDWRKCTQEMAAFKECMRKSGRFSDENKA